MEKLKRFWKKNIFLYDNDFIILKDNDKINIFGTPNVFEISKKCNFILFDFQEDIPKEELLNIEKIIDSGCITYFTSFILTLKNYFDLNYPHHKAFFPDLSSSSERHISITRMEEMLNCPTEERKYLLKYFGASRKPWRDDVIYFLKQNNLLYLDENLITYRNYTGVNEQNYLEYINENSFNESDYSTLDDFEIIHDSQINVNPTTDQYLADTHLYQAHLDSYFLILTEAIYPYYNSKEPILQSISSVSKRVILPFLFKNVFHIYPKNKPLEEWLILNGFELFFESDNDFLKNLNKEYYFREDVQKKLENNSIKIRNILNRNLYLFLG